MDVREELLELERQRFLGLGERGTAFAAFLAGFPAFLLGGCDGREKQSRRQGKSQGSAYGSVRQRRFLNADGVT